MSESFDSHNLSAYDDFPHRYPPPPQPPPFPSIHNHTSLIAAISKAQKETGFKFRLPTYHPRDVRASARRALGLFRIKLPTSKGAERHDHGGCALVRCAFQSIMTFAAKEHAAHLKTRVIDIGAGGGGIHRHWKEGDDLDASFPLTCPEDHEKRDLLDQKIAEGEYDEKVVARMNVCDHKFDECPCKDGKVVIMQDSVYYIEKDDIFNHVRSGYPVFMSFHTHVGKAPEALDRQIFVEEEVEDDAEGVAQKTGRIIVLAKGNTHPYKHKPFDPVVDLPQDIVAVSLIDPEWCCQKNNDQNIWVYFPRDYYDKIRLRGEG